MKTSMQLKYLSECSSSFPDHVKESLEEGDFPKPISLKTFQINVGKRCNMACRHCHVSASPDRNEMMSREVAEKCIEIISEIPEIEIVDITGGAPEMNEHFPFLVKESKKLGKHIIDRCNLTILENSEFNHLYDLFIDNEVEVLASLPHFSQRYTDRQRGKGVFEKSISVLQKLNKKGYGGKYPLNLVYNPTGLFLSASQHQLEREFRGNLKKRYGIVFNNLYCINNMPINRFLQSLLKAGKFEDYMEMLVNAFNPSTLEGLMCRYQVSVSYDGYLYDCDFNQMLNMTAHPVSHLDQFDYEMFMNRKIQIANHCFGCTAGAGSSCGGEIAS